MRVFTVARLQIMLNLTVVFCVKHYYDLRWPVEVPLLEQFLRWDL